MGQRMIAEGGHEFCALAADIFGGGAGFAGGFEGGGEDAEFAEARPVGRGEGAPRVRCERQIGVPQRGQGGEKNKFTQRLPVAHDTLLHETFEAK